jgi:glycine/D-amino acid oxidase-like deaminating enzyme
MAVRRRGRRVLQRGDPLKGEPQVHPGSTDEFARDPAANPLPASVDVAIIGGGIVGCSAAYYLARAGVSVAVFEKGRVGGEQSGRNWGWVRQQCRSPVELPLMMQSLDLWKALPGELGEDIGFHQGGTLYLAEDEAQLAGLAEWLAVAKAHALDTRVLTDAEVAGIISGGARFAGALHTPSDGRAEPSRAARAIARGAKAAGATVASRTAVRGLDLAAGRVTGVVTEHGRVAARAVVCAGGAWTRLFCGSLGIDVPQLPLLNTVARMAPAPKLLEGQAWSPAVAIRRRADGGYTVAHGHHSRHSIVPASFRYAFKYLPAFRASPASVRLAFGGDFLRALAVPSRWRLDAPSPFERERVLNPAPETEIVREMRDAIARWYPELAACPFVETWGGMIEASPDILPIIAPAEAIPGFFIATGFSGHGFGIGPGAGRLVAAMVQGSADAASLAGFRLGRFFDGSPIVPGPAI